jgi:hypothetical protein
MQICLKSAFYPSIRRPSINLPLFPFPVVLHIQRAGHKDHFVLGSLSLVRLGVLLVLQIGDLRQRDCHDIKNHRFKLRKMRSKGCSGDQ